MPWTGRKFSNKICQLINFLWSQNFNIFTEKKVFCTLCWFNNKTSPSNFYFFFNQSLRFLIKKKYMLAKFICGLSVTFSIIEKRLYSHLLIIKPSFSKFGLLYPYIDIFFFKIFWKRKQWQNSKLWKCSRYVNYNFKNSYRKLNHISVKLDLKHIS